MAKPRAADGRVVIESVSPQVDGGRFPTKTTLGDSVDVTADVFADGHDMVACILRYRPASARAWSETPMELLGNDRWRGSFTPTELGPWQFEVMGWIDQFATWLDGLQKKLAAGLDVDVELAIGARLLMEAAGRVKGKDAERLASIAEAISEETSPQDERVALCASDHTVTLVRDHPDRSRASKSEIRWPVVVDRERAVFSTWYELFPRSWAKKAGEHGTFADVEERLDYVAGMGFDVLYVPPIHPIGITYRKGPDNRLGGGAGDPGVPWAIGSKEGGHTAINPLLGTIEDFRSLRDAAAARGVELALDIAFQCSPDHPWVTEHPEWFRHRPDGSIQYAENPPKRYQDIYPLDFETEDPEGLWMALKGVFDHWIDEGIRIFRVDNPHTKPFTFWEWVIGEIRQNHPDVILLGEAFTRPAVMHRLAKVGFNQSYTYFAWRNTRSELIQYMADLSEVSHFFRPSFWPNTPDILTEELQTGGRAAFIVRYVLAATLSSACGVYGPAFELMEHLPLHRGSEEYLHSEKYEIRRWDIDATNTLAPVIAQVNKARHSHPALQRNRSLVFHPADNDLLLCYSKSSADDVVLVVVNLDPHHAQAGWIALDLESLGLSPDQSFMVHDLLTDRRYLWHGQHNFVRLEPEGIPAHLFAVRPHVRTEEGFDYFI